MKKAQAIRQLDDNIYAFALRFVGLRFDAYFSERTFIGAHKLYDAKNKAFKAPRGSEEKHRFQSMAVNTYAYELSPTKQGPIQVGGMSFQDEELIEMLVQTFNNQCLHILAQAFEVYERFLKDLYGSLGYLDLNLWRCQDLGNATIAECRKKVPEWFKAKVRKTIGQHNTNDIVQVLRQRFSDFENREQKNKMTWDMMFWMRLIAYFRHAIVHSHGRLPAADLVKTLEKKTGRSLTGTKKTVRQRKYDVFKHLTKDQDCYQITLVERSKMKGSYAFATSHLNHLLERIVSHAYLVYELSLNHFGKKPYWQEKRIPQPLH